eukprot:2524650-Rhodomonas_salina.1
MHTAQLKLVQAAQVSFLININSLEVHDQWKTYTAKSISKSDKSTIPYHASSNAWYEFPSAVAVLWYKNICISYPYDCYNGTIGTGSTFLFAVGIFDASAHPPWTRSVSSVLLFNAQGILETPNKRRASHKRQGGQMGKYRPDTD